MDYEFKEYRASDVVKVDLLINGDRVDAFVHHHAPNYGRNTVVVPWPPRCARSFPVRCTTWRFRAAIGANIIARENIKGPACKNVLAKCYGGDISRNASCSKNKRASFKRA